MVALLALLTEQGQLPLSYLADQLGASAATIRRDVALLATQGLLERTHGGARPMKGNRELPVRLRDGRNHDAKRRIARTVAGIIPVGKHAIGLTGGTTTAEVLRALRHRDDLTIITNSLSIGLEAAEQGQARVLIAGGVLRSSSLELVGSLAESTMKLVNVGTAVVGADGVSATGGLTTHDEIEARTNLAMIERAQRVIVAIDSTKIGHTTLAKVADIKDIHVLVTDAGAPEAELQRIRDAGVEVHVVEGPRHH
ncbi:DeoR/GlpR transcriptional regulator [Tessaracoccus sp. MC1865]|uniref:DeoR/GlpR family DNA-binding transcription regulator n=1 Tax=Tessaracoccus sp. MC1865 TaxID=2760310 RepID=UPI0015FFBE58|nr:DeoR/GlpR family DNA-binding transcription regulator [Tessaracoccus sp. MC1865]MBB1483528.1 DeoR/GlpR transcriptional regulator [Tessaracoccus sp. MC1865]QTO36621.1 DeoR/GlpR transcriptional regulator [Tessaracoccus sp. MC1865]